MPAPPQNFHYNIINRELSWTIPPDADLSHIEFSSEILQNWVFLYEGPDTNCSFQQPPARYLVKGKVRDRVTKIWGDFGAPEIVEVL